MTSEITVRNVRPAPAPLVIICDVAIGAIQIHNVTLRLGRGQASYVNLPRSWAAGHWRPAVTIADRALLEQVEQAVTLAAAAATRYLQGFA
jgi:hypothetical protein